MVDLIFRSIQHTRTANLVSRLNLFKEFLAAIKSFLFRVYTRVVESSVGGIGQLSTVLSMSSQIVCERDQAPFSFLREIMWSWR